MSREGLQPIDPAKVAVYRLQNGRATDIIDPETRLIDSEELDAIADKLGDDFETALDLLHSI